MSEIMKFTDVKGTEHAYNVTEIVDVTKDKNGKSLVITKQKKFKIDSIQYKILVGAPMEVPQNG